MDFNITLEAGHKIEKEFASRMIVKYDGIEKVEFAPNYQFKDWDVKITRNWKDVYYECKRDYKSQETWNISLEFRHNGKPSWIYASKADYIVYCPQPWEFYRQDRWELLYRIAKVDKWITDWWDKDKSDMFLISKDKIDYLFHKL